MVTREEFYIKSSDGHSKIHCVNWKPEGEVLATLQITHGMMEHIMRYDQLAVYLADHGFGVLGHDHLGHGKSCGPDDKGFFAEEQGDIYMLKDIRRVTEVVRRKYPQIPHFIMGHSMGSFFLRRYLTIYGNQVDGAIIMGTGNEPLPLVALGKLLTSFIGSIKGDRYRSVLLHQLVLGNYNLSFRPSRTLHDWLSREEGMVDQFEGDSDCDFYFTCGAYRDFFRVLLDLKLKKHFHRIPKDLPMLIVSGEEDPVGGFGKGVRSVYRQFRQIGIEDVTLKLYPGARHEVVNESNREEVYKDIETWLLTNIQDHYK